MRFTHLDSSELTDTGKRRKNNEDAALSLPKSGVFCVADGMGGAADGEIASRAVVEALAEAFSGRHSDGDPDFARTKELVLEAVLNANAWIKENSDKRGFSGTGSTIVVMAFDPAGTDRAVVMHAGDSRAYRLRGDALMRLTKDHSLVSEAGLDDRDSLGPMFRAMVTRAVGIRTGLDLEESTVDVMENDLFLLCSDGLTTMVPDEVLKQVLLENRTLELNALARVLVDESNRRGGEDNITVVLVRVGKQIEAVELTSEPPPPAAPETPVSSADDQDEDLAFPPEEATEAEIPAEEPAEEPAAVEMPPEEIPAAATAVAGTPVNEAPEESPAEHIPDDLPGQMSDRDGSAERDTTPPSDDGTDLASPVEQPVSPTSDVEGVTPAVIRDNETTERVAVPTPEPVRRTPEPVPAGEPSSLRLWIAASIFGLGVVAAVWWFVGTPVSHRTPASPQKTSALPGTRPGPVRVEPATIPAVPQPQGSSRLSEGDIRNLRSAMPARLDGALQTGEWGAMSAYVKKWSQTVPDLLAGSGKGALYSSWVALWTKIRDGEVDAGLAYRQYRDEVTALCRKAGFDLPVEEADAASPGSRELRADAACRRIYKLQKHLADNVRHAAGRCEAEAGVLGPDPSRSLADLWTFTGEGDPDMLAASVARADRIAKDVDRLDKWLTACGDSHVTLPSVKMVPSVIVPRLLQAAREQREILARQIELVPARVKALRQQSAAGLSPVLDRIELLYTRAVDGQQASEAAVWQQTERRKHLHSLLEEVQNAVKVAEGRM